MYAYSLPGGADAGSARIEFSNIYFKYSGKRLTHLLLLKKSDGRSRCKGKRQEGRRQW